MNLLPRRHLNASPDQYGSGIRIHILDNDRTDFLQPQEVNQHHPLRRYALHNQIRGFYPFPPDINKLRRQSPVGNCGIKFITGIKQTDQAVKRNLNMPNMVQDLLHFPASNFSLAMTDRFSMVLC